ncbi:adenylate kinase [Candidatus Woesearchaeota archaeon CG10_big_fil_rev_8_21_14_0_10_45_16]|nr:MAG: adenylate kinase [Candidatus Woesearchaeota archaeon CG10_big_fil_rev_8_21_14_0_10_45_16]
MKVILLGPPGSGKGTMADRLVKDYGFVHLSTGNILREEISKGTEIGKKAKSLMDAGKYVPDEVVIEIVKKRLKDKDYLLDGFPRTVKQAEALGAVDQVIYLEISEDEVVKRFAGRRVDAAGTVYNVNTNPPPSGVKVIQRDDDKQEVVRKRFAEYSQKTKILVDYYGQKGLLHTVDAAPLPDKVYEDVKKIIEMSRSS